MVAGYSLLGKTATQHTTSYHTPNYTDSEGLIVQASVLYGAVNEYEVKCGGGLQQSEAAESLLDKLQ